MIVDAGAPSLVGPPPREGVDRERGTPLFHLWVGTPLRAPGTRTEILNASHRVLYRPTQRGGHCEYL